MIIVIASQKGGTGKTTVAVNIALATAAIKKPTALIDADEQGTTSTFYENTDYLKIYQAGEDVRTLAGKLQENVIIIDTPPNVSTIPQLAMAAADLVIIPTQASPYDIAASAGTVDIRNRLSESLGWAPPCYFLLNRIKHGTTLGKESAAYLTDTYAIPVLKTRLHDYELYRQAPLAGRSVMEHNAKHKAAREMANLVIEINRICKKTRKNVS